nr:hypothetical protein CFP56_67424 [Quercus suber]
MQWSKSSICNVSKSLAEKKHLLKQVEATAISGKGMEAFLKLKSEIQDLLRMEEKLWQQRSHDHWMVLGDSNSKYFHNRATQRFRKNKISELRNSEGVLMSGDSNVSSMMIGYYSKLFTTFEPSNIEEVVQFTNRVVTDEMSTVKSGYRFLHEWQGLDGFRGQVSDDQKRFWKSIWRIKVPGKIKHFIWKACSNSLPTKENLLRRRVLQDSVCHLCDRELEDVFHAL